MVASRGVGRVMAEEIERVRIAQLDIHNYATWKIRMKADLVSRDLWAVTSEVGRPETRAASAGASEKALSRIILYVKDQHLAKIARCKTAKEACDMLAAEFESSSMARQLQLRRRLHTLSKGPIEPLTSYFGRAKTLWNDLSAVGHEIGETEIVWAVLAGLPEKYDVIFTVLMVKDAEELTLEKVNPVLQQVNDRDAEREDQEAKSEAYFVRGNSRGNGRGGQLPHGRDRSDFRTCYTCGQRGHVMANCPMAKLANSAVNQSSRGDRIADTNIAF